VKGTVVYAAVVVDGDVRVIFRLLQKKRWMNLRTFAHAISCLADQITPS